MSSWSATASITRRPTAIFPTWACSSARSTRPEMADNTKSTKKRGPFRGVAIWIIVALLLGLAAFSLFGRDGFEQIDTEQGLELRSEERRVGKECRARWWAEPERRKRRADEDGKRRKG